MDRCGAATLVTMHSAASIHSEVRGTMLPQKNCASLSIARNEPSYLSVATGLPLLPAMGQRCSGWHPPNRHSGSRIPDRKSKSPAALLPLQEPPSGTPSHPGPQNIVPQVPAEFGFAGHLSPEQSP